MKPQHHPHGGPIIEHIIVHNPAELRARFGVDHPDDITHVVLTVDEFAQYERALIDEAAAAFGFDLADVPRPDWHAEIIAAARRACERPEVTGTG